MLFRSKVPNSDEIPTLTIEARSSPAYCYQIGEESGDKPWYFDIVNFLEKQEYPLNANIVERRTLQKLASQFFLSSNVLYRKSHHLGLLIYMLATTNDHLMEKVHGGVCGPHMNGLMLAKKIIQTGHFWLTIERDCVNFVKKCHQC